LRQAIHHHGKLFHELHLHVIELKFLKEADKQTHIVVLENDMRAIKSLGVFHHECRAHRVAGRENERLYFVEFEWVVNGYHGLLVEQIDFRVDNYHCACDHFVLENRNFVGEQLHLIAVQVTAL